MADDELTLEELDELDEKQRKKMRRQTLKEITAILSSEEGFRRLLAITDEEWAEAVDKDEGGTGGAA